MTFMTAKEDCWSSWRKRTGRMTAAALVLWGLSAPCLGGQPLATVAPRTDLAPASVHAKIETEILNILNRRYYREVEIDNAFSSRVFDRYLNDLDENRLYFTIRDIEAFEPLRHQLDEALRQGDLGPAFRIFNLYQQRVAERLQFVLGILERGLARISFSADEKLETSRKDAPWPKDTAELNELWRKRVKGSVLELRLSDKKDEAILDLLLRRFRSQLHLLGQRNSEDAFRTFMGAFTQAYDPHTRYLSPRLSENFNIQMSLSLEGIGAILESDNEHTRVVRLVAGGPAERSGLLLPGHRIVSVGQGRSGEMVDVVGWRLDEVVDLIRGPKDTQVRLELIAPKQEADHPTTVVQLTRSTVALEDQAAGKRILHTSGEGPPRRIGLIDIPSFYIDFKGLQSGDEDYRSTVRDVRRLVEELMAEGIDGLIIDLRDNGGGALQEASQLVGLFIPTGPTVQVRSGSGRVSELRDSDPEMIYNGPLAVMVNRMSASASEIFAAAIQDYGRGLVIGEPTFGKGSVQQLVDLRQGQLKLTTAMFYRVSGLSTQHQGVTPDILLPAVYDPAILGESALEGALPPDQVTAARFQAAPKPATEVLDWIRSRHAARIRTDPEFAYLLAGIDHERQTREEKFVSLREETRRRERAAEDRWRLDQENKRRGAKGLAPLKRLADLDKGEKDAETRGPGSARRAEPDPLQVESSRILTDYLQRRGTLTGMAGGPNGVTRARNGS